MSNEQEPVAWAVDYGNGIDADDIFRDREDAEDASADSNGPKVIVPLYRLPTLTDEELAVLKEYLQTLTATVRDLEAWHGGSEAVLHYSNKATILRGLLERLGGPNA